MIDLVSLRLFVRAAELGSFSKAAEQSNLALAAVSRRIALLEGHFGVDLFSRTGRGVEVTPAGRVLLDRAREILLQARLADADLSDFTKGLRGTVGLMASTSAVSQFLPSDLAAFSRLCPELRIDLREAYTDEIVGALRDGRTEVGVVISGPNVVDLDTVPYRTDRLTVVAPRDFMPGVQKVRLIDLIANDFVVMDDRTAISRLLKTAASEAGSAMRLRVKVGSFDVVCRMVQAGFGLSVQPRMAAEHFQATMGLRLIDLDEPWAERQMLICTSPQTGVSLAARRLVFHLGECARIGAGLAN
ncbi:MAG: LysR substrate-binding domain-containing protein [Alphaproteobacteria bacterium]